MLQMIQVQMSLLKRLRKIFYSCNFMWFPYATQDPTLISKIHTIPNMQLFGANCKKIDQIIRRWSLKSLIISNIINSIDVIARNFKYTPVYANWIKNNDQFADIKMFDLT